LGKFMTAATEAPVLESRVGDGTYVLDPAQRARTPLFRRRRQWLRDPDGLLICCFAAEAR